MHMWWHVAGTYALLSAAPQHTAYQYTRVVLGGNGASLSSLAECSLVTSTSSMATSAPYSPPPPPMLLEIAVLFSITFFHH